MSADLQSSVPSTVPLGQRSPYPKAYDKGLLQPVPRAMQRRAMNLPVDISFYGFDVWNAYELYWHDPKGKPVRAFATFVVPANTVNLCESKSVKLYLNSLNHEKFSCMDDVVRVVTRDLSDICQQLVQVIMTPAHLTKLDSHVNSLYKCLDELDVKIDKYERAPELLVVGSEHVMDHRLVSHLFKSHCLCTGQPDFGSIFLEYTGPKIKDTSLLAYLASYRDHRGFSENCIEQIYFDIYQRVQPKKLLVFGRFTRRGGIDINPYRATHDISFLSSRLIYQ